MSKIRWKQKFRVGVDRGGLIVSITTAILNHFHDLIKYSEVELG